MIDRKATHSNAIMANYDNLPQPVRDVLKDWNGRAAFQRLCNLGIPFKTAERLVQATTNRDGGGIRIKEAP